MLLRAPKCYLYLMEFIAIFHTNVIRTVFICLIEYYIRTLYIMDRVPIPRHTLNKKFVFRLRCVFLLAH